MWRILVALALMCGAVLVGESSSGVAYAQPVLTPWRPPVGCSTNDFIKFNGTVWVCGTASTFSTLNVIPKGDGTGLTASSWTDDGSTTATSAILDVNNDVSKFGSSDGAVYFAGSAINSRYATNGTDGLIVNNAGYQGGFTQFRNLTIADGKAGTVATFTGSDKSVSMPGFVGVGIAPDSNVGLKIAKPSGATYGLVVSTGGVELGQDGSGTTAYGNLIVNGNATLGDTPASDTHTINGVTTIKGGSTTNQVRLSDAIGNYWGLGRDNLSSGNFHLSTSAGTKVEVSTTGALALGDTARTAADSNVDILTIGNTGTGQTTTGKALIAATNTGSYNTTAGVISALGLLCTMTSTRSAGANALTNKCGSFSASGAQTNIALETDLGDVRFNISGGSSEFRGDVDIGNANTDTLTITSKIDSHVYYTGTAPSLSSCGTSPTIVGNDSRGVITPGSGATACTITFASSWTTNAPACVFTVQRTGAPTDVPFISASSTSAITVESASIDGDEGSPKIHYHCDGVL